MSSCIIPMEQFETTGCTLGPKQICWERPMYIIVVLHVLVLPCLGVRRHTASVTDTSHTTRLERRAVIASDGTQHAFHLLANGRKRSQPRCRTDPRAWNICAQLTLPSRTDQPVRAVPRVDIFINLLYAQETSDLGGDSIGKSSMHAKVPFLT